MRFQNSFYVLLFSSKCALTFQVKITLTKYAKI